MEYQWGEKFNDDSSSWNTRNVTDMSSCFMGAGSFDQDLSGWDVSRVESMDRMFSSDSVETGRKQGRKHVEHVQQRERLQRRFIWMERRTHDGHEVYVH